MRWDCAISSRVSWTVGTRMTPPGLQRSRRVGVRVRVRVRVMRSRRGRGGGRG